MIVARFTEIVESLGCQHDWVKDEFGVVLINLQESEPELHYVIVV